MTSYTLLTASATGQRNESVSQAHSNGQGGGVPSVKSDAELTDIGHLIPGSFGKPDENGLYEDAADAFFSLERLFDPEVYQRIIEWRNQFQTEIDGQLIFEQMVKWE